jgi:hypothetical protein
LHEASETPEKAATGATYRFFLLRCWRVEGSPAHDVSDWRFVLVEAGSARRAFPSLEALATYLRDELVKGPAAPNDE